MYGMIIWLDNVDDDQRHRRGIERRMTLLRAPAGPDHLRTLTLRQCWSSCGRYWLCADVVLAYCTPPSFFLNRCCRHSAYLIQPNALVKHMYFESVISFQVGDLSSRHKI